MENLTEFVIGSDKRADLERRRVIHRDGKICFDRFGTAKIRKFVPETPILPGRFRFPFSRERESAASFHSRRLASPRLASAADRGRHFHKDRRGAKRRESKTARNRVGVSRDDRLASVIERRAICSGKVIYASAACDRFPRSAKSPQDREEEKEKEEKEERTAALSPRFKPFSIATLSRRGGETKSKTNSNSKICFKVFSVSYIFCNIDIHDATENSYIGFTYTPFLGSLIYRNSRVQG